MNPILKLLDRADLLTLGFGATAAMWAVGYICRIPPVFVPSAVLLLLLLLCLLAGGYLAGRYTPMGWRGGLYTGLLASTLNLLVLGSLITGDAPNRIVPSALLWIPGSYLVSGAVAAAGAAFAGAYTKTAALNWTALYIRTAAGTTFFLIFIGGLVTSHKAGLAVVDWPNSFGYNMFLYPLSRMTGGIYYEHAHRLFGSLVGLTTVVMALHLWRTDARRWVKWLGLVCVLLVLIQGILGGLRVTGTFTLSASPQDTAPSIQLAILHGVLGQIFFAVMIAMAVFTSPAWIAAHAPQPVPSATADRVLTALLSGVLIIQLVLGAILRHIAHGLLIHISAAAIVAALAIITGVRAWGLYPNEPVLPRLGLTLLKAISLQLVLGLCALAATGMTRLPDQPPHAVDVIFTTTHQITGALLLAITVALMLWTWRRLAPQPVTQSQSSPHEAHVR
ncbi:MAG: COX15/CtaA family protein [bacterium]